MERATMRRLATFGCSALVVTAVAFAEDPKAAAPAPSPEEQAMMQAYEAAAKPGAPHQQLAASAGKWNAKVTMFMAPGAPPSISAATSTRTMAMDGRYLEDDFSGEVGGMPFHGHGVTGYDNVRGQYWSTWMDNMSTGIMLSWGTYDAATKSMTMTADSVDPVSKKPTKIRTVLRWPDTEHEVMEMWESRGGKDVKTLQIDSERVTSVR